CHPRGAQGRLREGSHAHAPTLDGADPQLVSHHRRAVESGAPRHRHHALTTFRTTPLTRTAWRPPWSSTKPSDGGSRAESPREPSCTTRVSKAPFSGLKHRARSSLGDSGGGAGRPC